MQLYQTERYGKALEVSSASARSSPPVVSFSKSDEMVTEKGSNGTRVCRARRRSDQYLCPVSPASPSLRIDVCCGVEQIYCLPDTHHTLRNLHQTNAGNIDKQAAKTMGRCWWMVASTSPATSKEDIPIHVRAVKSFVLASPLVLLLWKSIGVRYSTVEPARQGIS
ncbi:hypothetical protein BKA81DRAFT_374473 [Phyllosticta paracitricarpa]